MIGAILVGWWRTRPRPGVDEPVDGSVDAAGAGVVLEEQASGAEQDGADADGDQPPRVVRETEPGHHRGHAQPERPVAPGAEEADLTGTVDDLGIVAVLRSGVDAAG